MVPLESNPEVFTKFARNLGLSETWSFLDIYSLTDDDLLAFVPRPIKAIIMLFPLNKVLEGLKNSDEIDSQDSPIWFKQTIKNACGLYALLHSLSNNTSMLKEGSLLLDFLTSHRKEDAKYAGDESTDNFLISINEIYNENSQSGETAAPSSEEDVDLHFITFVEKEGNIYELDGRNLSGARLLGKSRSSDLLQEPLIADRFQYYQDHATDSMKLHFSLLGLGPCLD